MDIFITPSLRGGRGAYAATNPPKYFVELRGGGHFESTNVSCLGKKTVAACLGSKRNVRLIDEYGIAFFDCYLKGQPEDLDRLTGSGLATYKHSGRP